MFASQSRTRVSNLRVALARTRKENLTTAQYFTKMKGFAGELAAAGRPLDVEELVEYLLAGLDESYNALFAAIGINGARTSPSPTCTTTSPPTTTASSSSPTTLAEEIPPSTLHIMGMVDRVDIEDAMEAVATTTVVEDVTNVAAVVVVAETVEP
jgi:hypothetical protein